MNNLIVRLKYIAAGIEDLAHYGPSRKPEERGLSYATPPTNPDPYKQRVGEGLSAEASTRLISQVQGALKMYDPSLADRRRDTLPSTLHNALDIMKGAVMIAFPQLLPPYDPISLLLHTEMDWAAGHQTSKELYNPSSDVLWFASSALSRDALLEAYIGRNDKTTIRVRPGRKGKGAPAKETEMSEEKKQMMSFFYKKQKELEELEKDKSTDYASKEYADPHGMKKNLQGIGDIRFPRK
eukprot:gnl/Carplike_NY0171/4338_a5888_477.p1 GENE.gnl/Carplike_NY0171/4338_a5888_477~~gnl/Carplike_NY0171/4338_a5888_477.p1  ORF type:complete len:276 (+),score=70.63 gnl/Carplike_NY0171/4338_a5888_477:113-829(+)